MSLIPQTRTDDLREYNRARVLAIVREFSVASRSEISDQTGLSAATVSAITHDLLAENILVHPPKAQAAKSSRGRPKVSLAMNSLAATACVVSFHLEGATATVVDYCGTKICEAHVPLKDVYLDSAAIQKSLFSVIDQAIVEVPKQFPPIAQIAVGFQGVTDVQGRTVLWSPITDARDIAIANWLQEHYATPTTVANDCDMIAKGLKRCFPQQFGDDFAAILLSYGVGMGLFLRGEIVNGTRSSGIEFGHMTYSPNGALCRCGNYGCIEAYAGDYGIARSAAALPAAHTPSRLEHSPSLQAIAQAAQNGDQNALAAIADAGAAIGTGLASLYALVDAFPVALVGRGTIFFDLLEPHIRKALDTAPGVKPEKPITISCHEDESSFVYEGCVTTALHNQDRAVAEKNRSDTLLNVDVYENETPITAHKEPALP